MRRWLAILWFVVGFALTLELATRVDQYWSSGAPPWGVYTYDSVLFTRDQWGVRGRPGAVYEKWSLNQLGLRGPEASQEPVPRVERIVCLGASETFGLYESPDGEWPRQLARHLRAAGQRVEVLNAALPGMSQPAQLRQLQRRIVELRPDVVVAMLHYASLAGQTPERIERVLGRGPEAIPSGPVHAWWAALKPRLPGKIQDSLLPRTPAWIRDPIDRVRIDLQLVDLREREGNDYRRRKALSIEEEAALRALLEAYAELAQDAGFSLVVVIPSRRFSERDLKLHYLSFPDVDEAWVRDATRRFPEIARGVAAEKGFEVVDLPSAMRGREEALMVDMVHLNDEGADLVAEWVIEAIGRLPGAERSPAP